MDVSVRPKLLSGGLANINFLLMLNIGEAVLRRPPAGPIPPGAHDMAREHRVLSALNGAGARGEFGHAPEILHFCNDPAIAGAPFQLLRYYDGRAIRGDALEPLPETPETGRALSAMLIETMSQIHAVDCDAVGLGRLGRPEGFLQRTATGWIDRAKAVLDNRLPRAAAQVASWLERQPLPQSHATTLLHNDFKLDNILLRHETIDPLVVLDWDMATRGEPLFDLAIMLSYWAEPGDPDCMHRLAQMPTARPGFWTREQAAEAYAEKTGRSLSGFRYMRVLAIFRLAVVFHQLHARYAAEGTLDAHKAGFGALADEIFIFAAGVAQGERF